MSDAPIITLTKDGSLKVQNISKLVLSDGTEAEVKETMFLCRCGHSKNKPFCDGSHKREGWSE